MMRRQESAKKAAQGGGYDGSTGTMAGFTPERAGGKVEFIGTAKKAGKMATTYAPS